MEEYKIEEIEKVIEEKKENTWHKFSWKVAQIACDILDRIDPEEAAQDFLEALVCEINSALIYTNDQWQVIQEYINPDEIGSVSFSEVMDRFIEDMMTL